MKLVVLDDHTLVILLGVEATRSDVSQMNQWLQENVPGWIVLVFGGVDGEIIDLRDHPELQELADELHAKIMDEYLSKATGPRLVQ